MQFWSFTMLTIKKTAALAAIATLALAATDLSASAQSSLTNGPDGRQTDTLSPGTAGSRAPVRRRAVRESRAATRHASYADRRPLTVRRAGGAAPLAEPAVAPVVNTGPGTIVTGPLGFGSALVSLPFRGLNGIFPATGDIATNPLVLIGAPIHAIGDLAQVPFRIIGAPFGGTTIATD